MKTKIYLKKFFGKFLRLADRPLQLLIDNLSVL
jgi:hypothetical protein